MMNSIASYLQVSPANAEMFHECLPNSRHHLSVSKYVYGILLATFGLGHCIHIQFYTPVDANKLL